MYTYKIVSSTSTCIKLFSKYVDSKIFSQSKCFIESENLISDNFKKKKNR